MLLMLRILATVILQNPLAEVLLGLATQFYVLGAIEAFVSGATTVLFTSILKDSPCVKIFAIYVTEGSTR